MKRVLSLLLITLSVFLLISCGGEMSNENSTPATLVESQEPLPPEEPEHTVTFVSRYISVPIEVSEGYSAYGFRSLEELNAFFDKDVKKENVDVFSKYDDAFFAEKVLTMIPLSVYDKEASYRVYGAEITIDNGEDAVSLEIEIDDSETNKHWSVFVESKEALFATDKLETQYLKTFWHIAKDPAQPDMPSKTRVEYTARSHAIFTPIPEGYFAVCFRSLEELTTYYDKKLNSEFYAKYDEAFFENHVLTAISMPAGDYGTRYQLNGVETVLDDGEKKVIFQINHFLGSGSQATRQWTIYIETEEPLFSGQMLETKNTERFYFRSKISRAQQKLFE